MPSFKPTSSRYEFDYTESLKNFQNALQFSNDSTFDVLVVREEVQNILSSIESRQLENSGNYKKLIQNSDKLIAAADKLQNKINTKNVEQIADAADYYSILVDNLLLVYRILQLENNIDLDDQNQKISSDVNSKLDEKSLRNSFSKQFKNYQQNSDSFNELNNKLPQYLSQLPLGICVAMGEDLIFEYVNSTYLQIVDRDDSIVGQKIADVLNDIDTQRVFDEVRKVFQTGIPYSSNELLVKLNRYDSWQNAYFNLVCQPIRELDNTISGVVVICTEVTDIVESKKLLEESEFKFRYIIDKSPVAKAILRGPEFKVEIANKKMLEFFWRRKLDEVTGRPFLHIFPELEAQEFPKRLRQVYASGVAYSESNAVAYVDSEEGRNEYIIDYEYAPLLNSNGMVDGVMISAYDVTERVRAETALKISEEQFKSIASVMQQFIWTAAPDGKLVYWNQAVFQYSGITEEELEKNGWISIIHPDDRVENLKQWEKSIATGEDFIQEHRFCKKNGDYRWQLSRAVAQKDENGKILQWVGTSTDIHDQITFQETLEDLVDARTKDLSKINIELQSSNQDLESFAYISSHDLQEPLRKIQTFISIILDSDYENLSDRGKSYFLRVESAAARMKRLITDLLTYSRTSAVDKDFEEVNLQELLEEIQGDFLDTLEEKNGRISIETMPVISGISFQLRQLFVNLISNSIKFAKEGIPPEIEITRRIVNGEEIETTDLYKNQKYVEITIKDNGIGFSQEYASKIFEVFQRLHAKGTYDGTGIGLAICKKIIDKHHGLISAASTAGEGATFKIILPLQQ